MKPLLRNMFTGFRKTIALVLVLTVLLSISVPTVAFAEEDPATDSEIYALLYYADTNKMDSDGRITEVKNIEMVLQKGSEPDPNKRLVVDSDGKQGVIKSTKVDAYPAWYSFAPTANNYNIVKIDFKDKLKPTSIAGWFRNCRLVTNENFLHKENLDTSECTDMQYAFYLCSGLKSIDFTEWSSFSAEKVRKLGYFLSDCTSIETADLTTLHPVECSDAPYVFKNCTSLTKVKLNNFSITQNIKGKAYMNNFFMNCKKLETVGNSDDDSVNLSEFKATKPMSYDSMFRGCVSLRKADLSKLGEYNTNDAVYISNMFYDCTSLEEIDMTNFRIEFSPRNFLVNARAVRELKVPDATKTNNLGKNESRALFQYADKLSYVEISPAWKQNAALTYLPANTQWKKVKLSGNVDESPIGTEKTAEELFKNFQPAYAGGWSTEATFDFKGNGGTSEVQTATGLMGTVINTDNIVDPIRDGYDFVGWYSEPDGTGEEFKGTANHWTYYAKWVDKQYTLILNANGGHKKDDTSAETISQTLNYSDWVTLGDGGFVNGDRVLVGWNTNQQGAGTAYTATDAIGMLTPDTDEFTLYAMWGTNAATITFDAQEGSEVSAKTYSNLPANYGILSESTRLGYTFMGWYTAATGGTKIEENDPVTGNRRLYAHWEKNPVITLNANGGFFKVDDDHQSDTYTKECDYNGSVGYLTVPSHATATFLGWLTESGDAGVQISSDTKVTSDITIYAHWGYKPVLDTDGGIIEGSFEGFPSADSPEGYKIEELPEVRKDNYTFDGWYHGNTLVEAESTIDLSTDKVIKAHWKQKDSVTVTLNANGGTLPDNTDNTITVYKGNPVAALPTPTKENCDFEGWFTAASGGEKVTANTTASSDMTLYAHWAQLNCKVTFHPDKGTLLGDSEVYIAAGKPMDYIPGIYNPAAGETFIGWYTEEGGKGTKLNSDTVITKDTDYYPRWDAQLQSDTVTGVNFMAKWDTVSDSNVTDIGNYLVFHPANNNKVTATLKVVLMMEGVQTTPVPVGALQLKVPRYVFKDYLGNPVGTDNLGAMASDKYALTSDGDYYIFTNKVEIRSDFDTFTIEYTVTPRQVNGGYYDENEIAREYLKQDDLKVTLDINKSSYPNADEQLTTKEQELGLEFHTKVYTTPSKTRSNVALEWNESWGDRPADADEYFYVTWALNSDHANTSSQRFKLLWDEDTYGRDGSIIYASGAVSYNEETEGKWTGWRSSGRSTAYVVTKHRRDQATVHTSDGDIWAKVHNEAVLNVKWESGYEQQFRVSAEATAYIPPSGSGAYSFTKTVPNTNSNAAHYVHGGQELILNGEADNMPKLPYEIKYSESYNVDNPGWDGNYYNAPERTYTLVECADRNANDVMISSCGDDLSQDNWNTNISHGLVDGDYYFDKLTINLTEYNASKIGETQWSNPQEHPVRSDYLPVEVLIRRQNSTEFESYKTVIIPKEGVTVVLPEDTAGFKLVHRSSAYTTNITVKTNVCLKPSSQLRAYVAQAVQDGNYTIIKNKAQMEVSPEDGTARSFDTKNNGSWPSTYVLDMSSIYLYARKDCADDDSDVVYDPDTLTESFPAVISGWNYNNSGNKTLFKSGEFYDLLPKDYSVDRNSIFINPIRENWSETYYNKTAKIKANLYNNNTIRSDALPKSAYSVRLIENWEDTGRTMMIVKVSVPDSVRATGVNVFYQMKVRYASVYADGVTQNNIVVFKDTTSGQIVPEGKSTAIGEGDVPVELISHFTQFDGTNTAFASDSTHCVEPPVRESGLSSVVYAENSDMTEHELVGLNTDYCYHITYSSGVNAMCDDLVFYNVLEHRIDGAESEWEGDFLGVDVSALEAVENAYNKNAKCAPVIYYSTADKSSFTKNNYGEETDSFTLDPTVNPGLWTTEMPPLDQITAIAVDCRKDNKGEKFYLDAEKTIDFKINMKSISDKSRNDIYAYNETIIRFNLTAQEKDKRVHLLSKTDVQLHFNTPQLDKTSFPASGTAGTPTPVVKDSMLNYTISITNPDSAVTMGDIVVSDVFDTSKVQVNPDNITVRLDDDAEASLARHARIKGYELTNAGDFTVTIGTLEPHETLVITVPVKVIGADKDPITNTAQITSVNGVTYDVKSPTTYHQIDTLKLKINKVNSKGDPLSGAKLVILSEGDQTVIRPAFTTNGTPVIFDITPGSYILHETEAPTGYKTADDISFRVAGDGRVFIDNEAYDAVTMVNEPAYKVVFHENNPTIDDKDVVFKTVESTELGTTDMKIPHFYDIPAWAGDEYVFAGWYYADDEGSEFALNASAADTPLNFEEQEYPPTDETDPQDYHIYAHWIEVGSVSKDAGDTNNIKGGYRGFGLMGVQIRPKTTKVKDPDTGEYLDADMYDPNIRDQIAGYTDAEYNDNVKVTTEGMRFVTSLSERLLSAVNGIDKIEDTPEVGKTFGVEYGYVVGTEDNINTFVDHYSDADKTNYSLQYKGENVNGVNTTGKTPSAATDYRYITNVDCTSRVGDNINAGVVRWDHRNFGEYRLYTLVVTYDDEESQSKLDKKLNARAYMRYYDANGKLRVFYNNYRNNMYYGGCLCSFSQAMNVVG